MDVLAWRSALGASSELVLQNIDSDETGHANCWSYLATFESGHDPDRGLTPRVSLWIPARVRSHGSGILVAKDDTR